MRGERGRRRPRGSDISLRRLQIWASRHGEENLLSSARKEALISRANALRAERGKRRVKNLTQAVDVLVGHYGPRTTLDKILQEHPPAIQPEYAPKGTDEVAPQGDSPSNDAAMHGGDNSSQEVPDGMATGGNNDSTQSASASEAKDSQSEPRSVAGVAGEASVVARDGDASQPDADDVKSAASETADSTSDTHEAAEVGQEASFGPDRRSSAALSAEVDPERNGGLLRAETPRDESQPAREQASADGRPTAQAEQDKDACSRGLVSEETQADSAASEQEATGPQAKLLAEGSREPVPQKSKLAHGFKKSGKPSRTPRREDGGVTALLRQAQITPELLREARRRLAALVMDGEGEASPRRDYADFCVRLKTFRNPAPARKEESSRPAILILPDVSGSCAGFSNQSLAAAATPALSVMIARPLARTCAPTDIASAPTKSLTGTAARPAVILSGRSSKRRSARFDAKRGRNMSIKGRLRAKRGLLPSSGHGTSAEALDEASIFTRSVRRPAPKPEPPPKRPARLVKKK